MKQKKNIIKLPILVLILLSTFSFLNCNNDSYDEEEDETTTSESSIIAESYFNTSSLISIELVEARLEDGTTADCYQITFSGDAIDGELGPFCPETIDDIGGIAVYDGETNPGLRNISRDLLEDMEADGWNIVEDDTGLVYSNNNSGTSNCLALAYDADLNFVFTVPVVPKLASSSTDIDEVENLGFSIDGTPLTGDPPSAVFGPAMFGTQDISEIEEINFPSIDPCGGHPDPAGYYHAHFIPQVINQVLAANNIDEVECTMFEQTSGTVLAGFAKDGFPIYAYAEMPDDLDECNGRTAATTEYPDGVYHYVASTTAVTNMPPCLKGVAVQDSFEIQ
ncbi:YHYH protein [Polaribacter sp. Asnod6-C07]|uniref:YHYH protein n=1 Tax=Polaribacter sp. Asnod6-C07 TaxID=3160582 RepID=UPI00386E2446